MPKGRKKKGGPPGGRSSTESHHISEDELEVGDNLSVASSGGNLSEACGGSTAGDEVDELSAQEQFEDKLKDAIDGLTDKSAKTRIVNLQNLKAAFCKKYISYFVIDRKVTISDALERCLKKGKGDEQALAAINIILLCLQLGLGPDSEVIFTDVKPILQTVLQDKTASVKARSSCATALGLCTFLASDNQEQLQSSMSVLESIFKASYLKGDGNPPTHTSDVAGLHCNALNAWSILLSIAPWSMVGPALDKTLCKLPQLLESTHVDLRIDAGQAIALCYELGRDHDDEFQGDDVDELCEMLKQLATDGLKHRAKKDRLKQRSNFRDILKAVEEGESPDLCIKFGLESIYIESWVHKCQYDAICGVLASGTNTHLQENGLVRDIFGLGQPMSTIMLDKIRSSKTSPAERHFNNAAAFKARTKARAKTRDKRSAVISC